MMQKLQFSDMEFICIYHFHFLQSILNNLSTEQTTDTVYTYFHLISKFLVSSSSLKNLLLRC